MKRNLGKIIVVFLTVMLMFSTVANAYTYYSNGYVSAYIEIKNRSSYGNVFKNSLAAWTSTPTPALLKEVVVSDTYIGDGVYADNWYGLYTPKKLENIFGGRAKEFTIQLNRRLLVNESENFRQSVMVHELGHALCLDDNPPESPSIMRYDRNRNTMIKPQQDDIDGVKYAY